jgi:transposase
MSKVKQLNFENQTLYCGLDVHKSNWKVNLRLGGIDLGGFSQNPDPTLLVQHCHKNYPGAKVKVAYEAGFSGFGIYRSLKQQGLDCIVVNAADIPCSDKERKRKDDKRDARKICRELADGSLQGIYVPSEQLQHLRSLVRLRYRIVKDHVKCKNRIKHLLLFSGININAEERWNKKYVAELDKYKDETNLGVCLTLALDQYKQTRDLLKRATMALRSLAHQEPYAHLQQYLQSIDGVGLITGMVIQSEIQDIYRFKTLDKLCDYAGFVPDISSSDERITIRGITHRCNQFLREALIESSWMLIRKDPAMLMKYQYYKMRMGSNKAIIRIGKHLLARIRHVWIHQKVYQRGVVG